MRYYSITITKPDGTPYLFNALNGQPLSSLLPSGSQNPQYGTFNPGALGIELDIPAFNAGDPDNNAYLRVYGLGLSDIGPAANLNGCNVVISAGMSRGLPLANPRQAGRIMQGQVFQAFGNWVGDEQTVDMIFVAGGQSTGSANEPQNYPFLWQPNTPLSTAIAYTLSVGLPGFAQTINISAKLVINKTMTGFYKSLQEFADFIKGLSQSLIGQNYDGVSISISGMAVLVSDGTVAASSVTAILPQDLLGQPTHQAPLLISVKTVLRADIKLFDVVSLPKTLFTNTASAMTGLTGQTTFSGNYRVIQMHHFGNFRQSQGDAWNTTFQMSAEITS